MKRVNLFVFSLLLCPMMAFGQLRVDPSGNTYAKNIYIGNSSNFLGTDSNVPVVFKTNGVLSGSTGSSAHGNVSFGYNTLSSPSLSGPSNAAFGHEALKSNTTGQYSAAFGRAALMSNTTGLYNTAAGYSALANNISGTHNAAIGRSALAFSTGNYNAACGSYALLNTSTGNYNTACGYITLANNTSGQYNTAVGANALDNITTGSYNTAIGYSAGHSNPGTYTNVTAIGYNAQNTQSNQVRLGNTSVTSIGGNAGWTNFSDGRAKKNIRAEVPGLAFINLLQPVTYNLNLDAMDEILKSDAPVNDSLQTVRSPEEREILAKAKANKEKQVYSGFIAQDVEKAAQSIGYDFSGVDVPENEKSAYGLRYGDFVVPLVKAVQELSKQVEELTAKLEELTNAQKNPNTGVAVGANNFTFSLFPNPTNGFVTVDYTLINDAPITIELYNIFGQRTKLILPNQNQKAGTYNIQTSVSDLSVGTYIVKVTSGNQAESKQLIINN
jgi:hypothetical protein